MARKIIDFIKRVLNFIKSVTIIPAIKLILFMIKLLKRFARFIFGQLKRAKKYSYYKNQKSTAEREASRGFNLYKYKKVPAEISRAAKSGIRNQDKLNKARKKQERISPREKTRSYKSRKTQTLGSLKSLNSIKFK